jgi:hypothetical protein
MEGLHQTARPEWAARYAAELLRRGAPGSLKDLVADGCRLWVTAGQQSPESVARLHWQMRSGPQRAANDERAQEEPATPPDAKGRDGERT